jgi:hypothetical protein
MKRISGGRRYHAVCNRGRRLGFAHCACARPCLPFLKILIARRYKESHSSLKALGIAIFVISFALLSPTLSELLRSASLGSLGLRLATRLVVVVCIVQCALVFLKEETVAGFHRVAHSGTSFAGDRLNQPRKREGPNESSVATDRAANARRRRYAFRYQRKNGFVPSQSNF